ncbi:MAG: gamma-glutamylcyclotransferase, partial [Lachnospiraceae bacterium]|nr:gamma-glutamylcyclotransferase [Lachnospiraceae bacterium]
MKEKRYYIAYGSNLSVAQMKVRTPDAKIVGTGILYGW